MSVKPKTFKTNVEIEAVDIETLYELSDDDYRHYIESGGLFLVDHHDVLRSALAGYPLATTREQFDILIEELQKVRSKMVSRADK